MDSVYIVSLIENCGSAVLAAGSFSESVRSAEGFSSQHRKSFNVMSIIVLGVPVHCCVIAFFYSIILADTIVLALYSSP